MLSELAKKRLMESGFDGDSHNGFDGHGVDDGELPQPQPWPIIDRKQKPENSQPPAPAGSLQQAVSSRQAPVGPAGQSPGGQCTQCIFHLAAQALEEVTER